MLRFLILLVFFLNTISNYTFFQKSNKTFIPFRLDYNPNYWDYNIDTLYFSDEQLTEFENFKNLEPIICLRNAFNDYLNDINNSIYFTNEALGDSITVLEKNGLKAFGKYYFKSKFLVLNFINHPDDVLEVNIISAMYPDIIFSAKMIETKKEQPKYKLIEIYKSFHSYEEIHIMRNQIRHLLKNEKYLF